MNFWKKIRMMIFVGLGIFTVAISGQVFTAVDEEYGDEYVYKRVFTKLVGSSEFRIRLEKAIAQKLAIISKVSDLQITRGKRSYIVTFSVETVEGDIFEEIACYMRASFIPYRSSDTLLGPGTIDPVKPGFYLNECESSETVFRNPSIPFYMEEIISNVRTRIGISSYISLFTWKKL